MEDRGSLSTPGRSTAAPARFILRPGACIDVPPAFPSPHMKASDSEPAEALRRAQQALTAGDVVVARRLARKALDSDPREKEALEARDILARTDVAWPLLVYGAVAALCFLALVLVAVLRSGPA